MGEEKNKYFRMSFNQKMKLGLKSTEVIRPGRSGLPVIKEIDEQAGLAKIAKWGTR